MKYNYNNKNEYLHILLPEMPQVVKTFTTSAKKYPAKQIPMRVPPRTLEPIDELDIIKGLRILSD
jgi:hypothetical protein